MQLERGKQTQVLNVGKHNQKDTKW